MTRQMRFRLAIAASLSALFMVGTMPSVEGPCSFKQGEVGDGSSSFKEGWFSTLICWRVFRELGGAALP